jgi:hypothetical protein
MKPFFLAFMLTVCACQLHAQGYAFDSIGVQHMTIGKVTLKSDTWVIRVERAGGYDDFMPVNLPEKYAIPGQEVVFEGALGRIPMNVRMIGTPVKLSMIRVLYRTQPQDNGSTGETISTEKTTDPDSVGFINKQTGKILLISDVYLIETTIGDEVKRYVPDFLPDDFKVAGSVITFSAVIVKHDPNVRMMGTPVKIKELMMEENTPFDANNIQEPLKELYPFDSVGHIANVRATVKVIADVFVLETVMDGNNNSTRYLPAILPDAFKKENLVVIISGTVGKIPPNVRLMGTPLTLESIGVGE